MLHRDPTAVCTERARGVRGVLAAAAVAAIAFAASAQTSAAAADPLEGTEWWRAAVRVAGLTPPGPGVPITIIDSGVSFGHPEFLGRPNLVALNPQEPAPLGGVHGTAVASVAGAPVNGIGLVGMYPTAVLRSYDLAGGALPGNAATRLANGIRAAALAGRSVINLSLGERRRRPVVDEAIAEAVRRGNLIVAASGNSGTVGNRLAYPGANAHVLTVGATDPTDRVAPFSTRSPWVDLVAPGVDIPYASAEDGGFAVASGTSFSAPIVAAAAAWLWTVRPELDASQVAEILRRSARDIEARGFDAASGHGVLDMQAALSFPTPSPDSAEPNDNVTTAAALTTRAQPAGSTSGRVIAREDARDVLRVWLPASGRFTATVSADARVTLELFRGGTRTVVSASAANRLARASASARAGLSYTARRAQAAYLVVSPAAGVRTAAYELAVDVR